MEITVEQYTGPQRDLAWSFRLAEDSPRLLDAYVDLGSVWWRRTTAGQVIGHLQAVPREKDVWEVTNTAVVESQRGRGTARRCSNEPSTRHARRRFAA